MRRPFLIIVLLAGAVAPAITQTADKRTDKSANIEQTVLKLTRDWLDAEERHDRATLQRIIADDFQGTAPMGNTVFKEDVIPQEGTQARGLSVNAQELKARVFGDAAVVTGRGVQKSGEKRELRFTIIFAERKESWQMVAGHLSAVPREKWRNAAVTALAGSHRRCRIELLELVSAALARSGIASTDRQDSFGFGWNLNRHEKLCRIEVVLPRLVDNADVLSLGCLLVC
jgi:hypothetical protein